MKLPKIVQKVVDKVQEHQESLQENERQQGKLEEWKDKLKYAMEDHEVFRADCASYDALYGGTKQIRPIGDSNLYASDRYGDDTAYQQTQDARQVVNLVFQLVESQIDVTVPMPAVEPTEEIDEKERRDMIEGQLTYMASSTEMRRINSENERITKKNGLAWFKVGHNPDYTTHTRRGRIETYNPHPVNVITQPGVFRPREMDYLFHIENRTLDRVCRTYGEEFRDVLQEESTEYGFLDQFASDSSNHTQDREGNKMLSVVEAWYRDEDGDVCVLTWVNDTILREEPKFFYKRDDETGEIIEFDDIRIPKYDEEGNVVSYEDIRVPCHVPDEFPFIPWYNIPREKDSKGVADPYIIFDQQEGIKKVLSIEEAKQVKGTTKVITRTNSGLKGKMNDATLQVLETDDPTGDVKIIDLKTPERGLKDLYQIYVQAAKDALGITEASQGRAESTNLSGRALEQLAAQTAGRLSVKAEEKDIAYTELYRTWYNFLLAFEDQRVPYRTDGKDNKPVYGYWDKSLLVKQDADGEWYYPEFDIYIQAEDALPKDKRFILDLCQNSGDRMDNIEYWMLMESIGIPNATTILEREQEKEATAKEQAMQPPPEQGAMAEPGMAEPTQPGPEQIIQQLPLDLQQQFMQLPPEQQEAFLMQVQGEQAEPVQNMQQLPQQPDPMQQIAAIIQNLPPEQQQVFMQLLQKNPQQAIALLQQVAVGGEQVG